jgi:hypothetical protein
MRFPRRRHLAGLLVAMVGVPFASVAEAAPTMTAMSPQSGPVSGGTVATITGTELDRITRVWFGSVRANIVSQTATTLRVRSPSADFSGGATVNAATATEAATGAFNYRYFQMVTGMSPAQGSELGGTDVQFFGEGLDRVTRVVFLCDGAREEVAPLRQTSSSMFARTPRCWPGRTAVVLDAPDYGSGSVQDGFLFQDVVTPPAITSLSPDHGPPAGGTTVTARGTFLGDVTSVSFGGVEAAIGAKSDTALTFTTPPGVAGPVEVTFTNWEGSTKRSFTYDAPVPDPPAPDPPAPDPPAPDPPAPDVSPGSGAPAVLPGPILAPTPVAVPPAPAVAAASRPPRCTLKVRGKSLTAATTAIRRSGCRVGKVKRPKRVRKGTRLVVAGAALARGSTTRVDLTLRAKRR